MAWLCLHLGISPYASAPSIAERGRTVNRICSRVQSAGRPLSLGGERQHGCVRGRLPGRARGGHPAPIARGRAACVERGLVAAAGQIAGHRGQQRLIHPQPARRLRGQRVRQIRCQRPFAYRTPL